MLNEFYRKVTRLKFELQINIKNTNVANSRYYVPDYIPYLSFLLRKTLLKMLNKRQNDEHFQVES